MGRLRRLRPLKIIQAWIIPVTVALLVIFGVHNTLASPEPTAQELQEYLQDNSLAVGSETVKGYQQVFYTYKGNRIYMEGAEQSNLISPVASGQYIAWVKSTDGGSQIFLYDAIAKTTRQITSDSTNIRPSISGNRLVWQRWMNGSWQVYYYDGTFVRQLSSGNGVAIRSDLQGNMAAYAEYVNGGWQVISVNLINNETNIVVQGDETNAWPKVQQDGQVTTTIQESL